MISTILLYFAVVFAFIAALFIDVVNRPPLTINFGWLAIAFFGAGNTNATANVWGYRLPQ